MKIQDIDLLRGRCCIGGDWVEADDGALLEVTDPASGEVIARVPNVGEAETRRAVEAAEPRLGPPGVS